MVTFPANVQLSSLGLGTWRMGESTARRKREVAAVRTALEIGWRVITHRALLLFGLMLMIDGAYLGWTSYLTGGVFSPVSYLILIHVVVQQKVGAPCGIA